MTAENSTASIVVVGQNAAAGAPMPAVWQRWIAEKLLLRFEPNAIVEALAQHGFDRATAARAVLAAQNHPYLVAVKPIAPDA